MKPILYAANATDFFNLGLGVLSDAYSCLVYEKRNGAFYLEMEYPVEGALFKELQNNRLIKADAGHELTDQRFKIKKITKPIDGKVKVYAEHISYKAAELALKPHVNIRNATAQQALQQWQNNFIGDDKPFTLSSNITTLNSTSWDIRNVENPRQALGGVQGSILDVWGGEYKFDNYHISLFRERGVRANALIAYGRNITDFEQEEDITSVYTSVYPYAVYTDDEGVEHLVTIPEYIVDSAHVDKYPNRMVLPVDFTTEFGSEETPTIQRLRSMAQSYIESNEIGIPKVSIKLSHVDLSKTLDYKQYKGLEKVNLCDNVLVKFLKLGVDTTAKVIGIIWNVLLERYEELEIGESRSSLSSRLNAIDQEARQARKEASDARNFSSVAANGINMVFFGPDEPTATKVGDRWFEENGEYTISRVWDGVIWRVIHDPRITDQNARDIAEAQEGIEEAKQSADTANQQINDAIQNAGFSTLADLTADIQNISNRADANAQAAISDAYTANSNAQTAMSMATDLSGQVSDFELTVDGFNQTVNNYTDQVAQFTSDVNGLNSTVASYETQVDEFGNTVSTYATQVSQFENTVNGLNSTVSNYQSDVQGYQSQVSTLTNTVDGFNATVESVQADYSDLSSTVQSLGANIGVVEGQITNRVWQTDIQSAVDGIEIGGRNYFRPTYTQGNSRYSEETFENQPVYIVNNYWGQYMQRFDIGGNEKVVFSAWVKKGSGEPSSITFHPVQYTTDTAEGLTTRSSSPSQSVPVTDEWVRVQWATETHSDTKSMILHMIVSPRDSGVTALVSKIQVEKGNIATDWTPAPEDTLQLISHVETEWRQTAQGFEQSITRVETGLDGKASLVAFNTLTSTVDRTVQRIGDVEGNITQIESTVSGLQTTVSDKASQTQVTQLANGFNVLSTNFNNLEIGGRNLLIGTGTPPISGSTTNDGITLTESPEGLPQIRAEAGNGNWWANPMGLNSSSNLINNGLSNGDVFTFSIEIKSEDATRFSPPTIYFKPGMGYYSMAGSIKKEFSRVYYTGVWNSTGNVSFHMGFGGRVGTYVFRRAKLEKGNKATDWTPAPEDMATQAQFTVLNNNINLRVSKGDVMSQINLEAGRTLIDTDRLYLSANTTVFGGSAFIPNAAIESLSADKVTAGTIDFNTINGININADEITAGTISGANMYLSLNTGHFHSEGTYEEEAISFNPGDHDPFVFPAYVDIRDGVITSTNPDSGLGGRLTEIAAGTIYMVSNPDSLIRSDIQLSGGGIQFGQGARAGAISPGSGFIMQDHNNDRHAQYNYDGLTLALSERDIYFGVDGLRLSNGAYIERIGPVSDGMIWSVPGFMDFWSWGARAFSVYEGGVNYFRNLTMTGSNNNINARNINANETDLLRLNGTRSELADLTLGAYSGGQRYFRSSAVYDLPISSTSQVGITASGDFRRITSARKYKIDITTADNQLDLGRRLLSLDLTKWFDKGDTERYAEALSNSTSFEGIEPIKMHYGLIAEDVEEVGLSQFVDYQNGEVEGIYYDRLWIPLISVVRDHDELLESTTSMASSNVLRIEKLEKENKKLKERIAALEGAA